MPKHHYHHTGTFFRELFHGAAGLVTDCDGNAVEVRLAALVCCHCPRHSSCDLVIRFEVHGEYWEGTHLDPPEREETLSLVRAQLEVHDGQVLALPAELQKTLFWLYEAEIKEEARA